MYIAICDDEKNVCDQMKSMLEELQKDLELDLNIAVYDTGEKLYQDLECGKPIDVTFLDIELVKMNGVAIGHYIRDIRRDYKTQIVYISSKLNYAMKLFSTSPFDFMIKPIKKEQLASVIRKLQEAVGNQNEVFQYKNGEEIKQIPYRDILYFTSEGHWIEIHYMVHTKAGKEQDKRKFYGKIKQIAANSPGQFWEIHKSFLVNSDYVEKCRYDRLQMSSGEELPISRVYQKEIRTKIQRALRGRMG